VDAGLNALLEQAFPASAKRVIAFCWPYRGEVDVRFAMRAWRLRGATSALPEVLGPGRALRFRAWWPGVAMAPGPLGIPTPAGTDIVVPDAAFVPLVGFDAGGFRLGYGGGYFDRTLAAMDPRALVIGVGYESARLESIDPQSWDMPLDYLVTERGVYRRDGAKLEFLGAPPAGEASSRASPVCYAAEIAPGYFGEDAG